MKMNRLTKAGILIIVIGLSFLACTFYRSTKEGGGFSSGGLFGLKENGWSSISFSYFLAPRDYRMIVKTNTTIDVYVLGSEGMRLWRDENKLAPTHSFEGVRPQTVTFHLDNRDNYGLLVHNPSETTATYELSVSGYGIETDLLYTSLIIIVLGAVVSIVGLIPKGNRGKKQSASTRSVAVPAAAVALLILSVFIDACTTQSSSMLAPSWMKEGTYVNYDLTPRSLTYTNGVLDKSQSMTWFFPNGTIVKHNNVTSAIFRWECIQLNGDTVAVNVTYIITSDIPNDNFYASTIVDINTASRSVYLQNGTLIGTTNLWLPSSPADGQEVMLWDMSPDKITANITTKMPNGDNIWTSETPQGAQTAFSLLNVAGTINGKDINQAGFTGNGMYEYDTGLMLYGDLRFEPIFTALGIPDDPFSAITTNVDMGPERTVINWTYWLGLAAVVGAVAVIAVLMVVKRRRRR